MKSPAQSIKVRQGRFRTAALMAPLLAVLIISGCNVGMTKSGATGQQLKDNFNKLDLQKKIDIINSSPASPAEKKAMIDKAKADAGQKSN